jgi:rhamnosyltransferase
MSALGPFRELATEFVDLKDVGVVIPTYNAGHHWQQLHARLDQQGLSPYQILIIDSSSSDDTSLLAERAGYQVIVIPQKDFNHGATRQLGCDQLSWAKYLVFLTQDALLVQPNSVKLLLGPLLDPAVGAAYGRQLPRPKAGLIERHSRLFNYPSVSDVRSFDSRKTLGFRAIFFSNSFAVYRRSALEGVGGFPRDTIVSEEVTVVARMLMSGWKVAYQANATVFHSHSLTLVREFLRYFDIGVHHGRSSWLLDTFGRVKGEGLNYVRSELDLLWSQSPHLIPYALLRTLTKFVAYRLGTLERYLPVRLKSKLSGQPTFWSHGAGAQSVNSGVRPAAYSRTADVNTRR